MDPEHALIELSSQFMQHGHKSIALVAAAGVAQIRKLKGDLATENLLYRTALDARDLESARKDSAYIERNQCVALIARMALELGGRTVFVTKTAIEGWDQEWHNCVYIYLPTGQVSWHFHDCEAHLFDDLPKVGCAWDGHTTEEKYVRVNEAFKKAVA